MEGTLSMDCWFEDLYVLETSGGIRVEVMCGVEDVSK